MSDEYRLLYKPRRYDKPMNVAGFMSGSGTNLVKIIEYQQQLEEKGGCPYRLVAIFTDSLGSKAARIAEKHGIVCLANDIDRFYNLHRYPSKDWKEMGKGIKREIRKRYDAITLAMLEEFSRQTHINIDCIALAGYMSYLTEALLERYLVVNVHPADLTIVGEDGQRKYKGGRAVELAIKAGEKTISSSTHIARPKVDEGEVLMVSAPLKVNLGIEEFTPDEVLGLPNLLAQVAARNQERLKEAGDWVIFPKTLEMIAKGWFAAKDGQIYYKEGYGRDYGWWSAPLRLS